MLDLKLVQRYLMLNFWVMAGVCLLIVVLYETEVLLPLDRRQPQLGRAALAALGLVRRVCDDKGGQA